MIWLRLVLQWMLLSITERRTTGKCVKSATPAAYPHVFLKGGLSTNIRENKNLTFHTQGLGGDKTCVHQSRKLTGHELKRL